MSEETIRFGGSCPSCFADVPGEEAATDPGEDVKAAQADEDRRRSNLRTLAPILVAVPVVLVLGLVALYYAWLRPEPTVAMLDFDVLDEYYFPPMHGAPVAEPTAPASNAAPQTASGKAEPPVPASAGTDRYAAQIGIGATAEASAGELRAAPEAAGSGSGTRRIAQGGSASEATLSAAQGGGPNGLDFSLDVNTKRRSEALTEPDEIRDMIYARMSAQMQKLNQCYERELKVDPSLEGKWRIRYVVTRSGGVSSASAVPLEGGSPGLEECVALEVEKWSFERISKNQPVQRTVTFKPI